MIASIINGLAVFILGITGNIIGSRLKESMKQSLMNSIGLVVLVIGILGVIKTKNMMVLMISILLGTIVGELIDIDKWLNILGEFVEKRFKTKDERSVAYAFTNASLLFCMGAMSIVGSFEAGISKDYTTLLIKSAIDAVASLTMASTYGIGVALSGATVIVYQGFFTIMSTYLKPLMNAYIINEISSVGSIIIIALSLNILNITKIKTANLMPAIFIPILLYYLNMF